MSRAINSHHVNECNENLKISAIDDPGPGGANHKYLISSPSNPGMNDGVYCELNFQNGGIKEVGTNGITHESLIAVCIDRLECFQKGKYACEENEKALTYLKQAADALNSRTKKRVDRGVEGTMTV